MGRHSRLDEEQFSKSRSNFVVRPLPAAWSVLFLVQLFINTIVLGLFVLVLSLVDNGGRYTHYIGVFWARLNLALTGVRIHRSGLEHIRKDVSYVVMANHQSLYDVWALIGWLPMQLRWVFKDEIRRIPFFGFALMRMGHIPVTRGAGEKAIRTLRLAAERLRDGACVVFFPEGRRSDDGRLQEFKKGGFQVALTAGIPILPVTINGGRFIHGKSSLRANSGRMDIIVHPAIETAPYQPSGIDPLMEQVRREIESRLETGPLMGPHADLTSSASLAGTEVSRISRRAPATATCQAPAIHGVENRGRSPGR